MVCSTYSGKEKRSELEIISEIVYLSFSLSESSETRAQRDSSLRLFKVSWVIRMFAWVLKHLLAQDNPLKPQFGPGRASFPLQRELKEEVSVLVKGFHPPVAKALKP